LLPRDDRPRPADSDEAGRVVDLTRSLPRVGEWGLGLSYHAWCVYAPKRPISEDEIEREMHKVA